MIVFYDKHGVEMSLRKEDIDNVYSIFADGEDLTKCEKIVGYEVETNRHHFYNDAKIITDNWR